MSKPGQTRGEWPLPNMTIIPLTPAGKNWTELVRDSRQYSSGPSLDEKIGALDVLLHSTISTATGAALGLLDNELKNGLDYHGVPIDAVSGSLLQLMAWMLNSSAALSSGDTCMGIYGFRQSKKLITALKVRVAQSAQTKFQGESVKEEPTTVDTDPITSKYKDLG